jgi:LacI family transcriptional regulator
MVFEQVRFLFDRQPLMRKNPTMREIAAKANVALSTVSQVLNNRANVALETRERVLQAASELGYRSRVVTGSPLVTPLATVGLITRRHNQERLIVNPFYSYIIAGVERECQRQHVNLMYANVEVDERNHASSLPGMLLDELVDGVIIVGAFVEESIADISRRIRHNIVLVDAYTSKEAFDSVLIDNFDGAVSAVDHLLEQGHRHIGLIGSNPDSYPSILERRRGYGAALAARGLDPAYIEDGVHSRQSAYEAAERLLRRCPAITAVFACNDECAFGVMNAARDLGYRLPDDLSVIGFDDIDLAQEVTPALTTIHVDKALMGTMALRLLRDRAGDPERAAISAVINTQLIVRESVRKI